MKRILALLLVLVMAVPLFVMPTSASDPVSTVYISNNGNDENDGLTASTPVKTGARATAILGAQGGVIVITDVFTASAWNILTGVNTNGHFIFRGMNADGSSKFVQGRKNIASSCKLTFDNLTYHYNSTSGGAIYCQFNYLEMTSSVKMTTSGTVTDRNYYPLILAGNSVAGTASQACNIVLNGGTYNYIIGGCLGANAAGPINITVGGKANIMQRLYCGSSKGNATGDITLNINGGSIGEVLLGGITSGETSGNINVTVTGGSFGSISGKGSENATVTGKVSVDASNYAASLDSGFGDKIVNMPADATVTLAKSAGDRLAAAGTQVSAPVDGTYATRFVSTVNGLDYDGAGYEVVAAYGENTKSWTVNTTKVYRSIKEGNDTKTADDGKYYLTVTVKNISVEKYDDVTLIYRPFVVIDGVKYYGVASTCTYCDGAVK